MSSGEQRPTVIQGPTVFAIGWIPYRSPLLSWLPPTYREKSAWLKWSAWKKWAGLKGVFWTGNNPPPAAFDGFDDLRRFVDRKDFRAIVGFRDVSFEVDDSGVARLEVDNSGRLVRSDDEQIHRGGYTRIRLPFGVKSFYFANDIEEFEEGFEFRVRDHSERWDGGMLPLESTIYFRVGDRGNRVSKWLIGHEAPFAFTECAYKLHVNGDYEVKFSGSAIPSFNIYVDWKLVHQHSMESISELNLNRFLTAATHARNGRPRQIPFHTHRGNIKDFQ